MEGTQILINESTYHFDNKNEEIKKFCNNNSDRAAVRAYTDLQNK
jgi:hypothetical protein